MKTFTQKLAFYLYNHFIGNFIGFVIALASTNLVSHFFATKSIRNLWGLTTRKTLVDKQTFNIIELTISIVIGFVVFELISKAVTKKIEEMLPTWKNSIKKTVSLLDNRSYPGHEAVADQSRRKRNYRDVQ
jgi:hypothetical protein